MAVAASTSNSVVRGDTNSMWLRTRRWDLMYITFSVIVVPLPYLVYLLLRATNPADAAWDDWSRNLVNAFVAVAVGGPHMMSTFLRTGLDDSFKKRYPMLIRSSIIIPIVVVSLAFLNLTLLLTVFFFWAALHVLHQVTFIVELYNHKETTQVRRGSAVTPIARAIDYAVILTCLFPMAAFKISQGSFDIGVNDLTRVIPEFFQQAWFFYTMTAVFLAAVGAFVLKSVREYRSGILNVPKTTFVAFTVVIAFVMPALPNLDTAFQGLNTWHSFQYLAITFYIIKIKAAYGDLQASAPLVARFSKGKDSRGLYLLSAIMLVGSALVFAVVYALSHIITPQPGMLTQGIPYEQALGNWRFDVAYYTAILSFLWIHYYHDHFLFTDFESLDDAYAT
ncbi:MAG: hypothetical protein IT298_00215 [Chloroflexi bacterium]|nr:MAG: hypothetical protein UZ13_00762 [Chloroflexi bacterium OLB13]MBV6435847.1 hypothetical protein [Anaerolineae bacterium]MCC6564162.1 hypothetical protein [Chloroflexota bacterium]MDL1916491.1 hypothetical protein [Anaerolineae bacterium CFX4]OQY78290.1 MAG: hypothetical protein B6D42_16180 [Anaerolineae bacterium UTCFX5]